jgi:hypothetical protein
MCCAASSQVLNCGVLPCLASFCADLAALPLHRSAPFCAVLWRCTQCDAVQSPVVVLCLCCLTLKCSAWLQRVSSHLRHSAAAAHERLVNMLSSDTDSTCWRKLIHWRAQRLHAHAHAGMVNMGPHDDMITHDHTSEDKERGHFHLCRRGWA